MLKRILNLFKKQQIEKEPTEEEIRNEEIKNKEESLVKARNLKGLITNKTGWKEVKEIIQEYIDDARLRKLRTELHRANDKTIYELKLLDEDIYILEWVLQIPEQFIETTEEIIKEDAKNEENK